MTGTRSSFAGRRWLRAAALANTLSPELLVAAALKIAGKRTGPSEIEALLMATLVNPEAVQEVRAARH